MRSPYVPQVEHELDTRNFESFDEDTNGPSAGSSKRWMQRADPNFVGYTYKNFQAVGRDEGESSPMPISTLGAVFAIQKDL